MMQPQGVLLKDYPGQLERMLTRILLGIALLRKGNTSDAAKGKTSPQMTPDIPDWNPVSFVIGDFRSFRDPASSIFHRASAVK
jgi:hypothetical protein